jgi:hypothetical protein
MAGASAERQETAFVKKIKDSVKKNKNNPITIVAGKVTIEGVIDADKFTGRQTSGSEPYTDVQIFVYNEKKPINLSLKGESAPSLAGGGLKGLELAVPGITNKYMKAAHKHLVTKKKLRAGDKVPDVYGKIGDSEKVKIVVGNEAMGGPIHYMYIGKMDVNADYDVNKNILTFNNGQLIPSVKYAKEHDLYFRLRARREDQRFDPTAKDAKGIPKIYGKSPSRGDSAGRIVVTDKVATTGVIVNI